MRVQEEKKARKSKEKISVGNKVKFTMEIGKTYKIGNVFGITVNNELIQETRTGKVISISGINNERYLIKDDLLGASGWYTEDRIVELIN